MSSSNHLNITLSDDAVQFVRSSVSSGEYASESDVILEGLETLRQFKEERGRWEQEILLPAYNRLIADPSSAVPIDQVERNLEGKRRQRLEGR